MDHRCWLSQAVIDPRPGDFKAALRGSRRGPPPWKVRYSPCLSSKKMIARFSLLLLSAFVIIGEPADAQAVGVAVERRLAAELGLRIGDTLRLGAAPGARELAATVAAIYEPRPDPAEVGKQEWHIRMHLPDLADLLGAPDRVDRVGVGLAPGVPADSVAAVLNRTAFGFEAHSSWAIASESSQTFTVISRFHEAIGFISIVASAMFLLCIMLLKVEERRLDAAMMRFVGVRRRTIFGALLLEAVMVASLGSVLGTALAFAAGVATNSYYQRFFDTPLVFSRVTADVVLFSVALSLILGVSAGATAAWRLVQTRPMTLWRRE
jgi:putative ABC transport system permease protein